LAPAGFGFRLLDLFEKLTSLALGSKPDLASAALGLDVTCRSGSAD
jgi:hypothetical protein